AGGSHTFTVTEDNAGRLTGAGLNSTVTFTGVGHLYGGPGDDNFVLANGRGVSGVIWGRGGRDTLDYSGWSTGVFVELHNFFATGSAAVFDITRVVGGLGDDYLHGDGADNVLIGNGGGDILVGDEGNDTAQGGAGRDLAFG